ncbi:unnamed protein product [Moneuplotes crassus]|uniref:Uncharacterized protein n=1 Tax=Euplotes crassus TaxID=5936 RepID=A0AAD2D3Q8_EUPCR|nr:unnamed protein product [Moneuplotes crassus]
MEKKPMFTTEYDFLFKVLLIGDIGVGKSSIFNRFGKSTFTEDLKSTIGVDFLSIILDDVPGCKSEKLMVQLWDTAGQEKFRTITRTYFKGAHGAIIVYDICNKSSFNSVHGWVQDVDQYSTLGITKLLIGNKSDETTGRQVTFEEGQELANMYKMQFIETSAKTNTNVKEAFYTLTKLMNSAKVSSNGGFTSIKLKKKSLEKDRKKKRKCC